METIITATLAFLPSILVGDFPPQVISVLGSTFLGVPAWMWFGFAGIIALLLALDLGILNKGSKEISVAQSLKLSAFYIIVGLSFGVAVHQFLGPEMAFAYWTGFVVEKTLAMDNLFVIAIIFGNLAIPRQYQHRVLFWGILGVLVLRGIMIGAGAAVVHQFEWVLYVFAAFLVFTGFKLLLGGDEGEGTGEGAVARTLKRNIRLTNGLRGDRFFVREPDSRTGRVLLHATPLFLALLLVEIADLIFAVDSIPAIFAITTDPFIVYTSNVFAILGLRALYFALSAIMDRFHYMKYALAALLIFIGSKMFIADLLGLQKFPQSLSLGITLALLAGGVLYSLWRTRGDAPAHGGAKAEAEPVRVQA
jgi:tellurite resistance protein TerC